MKLRCDKCPGTEGKEVTRKQLLTARATSGAPMTCHTLECGHAWHISYSGNPTLTECTCPDYTPPAVGH